MVQNIPLQSISMLTLEELRRVLLDWDIEQRIREKIQIWGLRYTPKKLAAIPTDFISAAIIYYMAQRMRPHISNLTQPTIMSLSHRLKLIYNSLAIAQFKRSSFFEFSLLILAKLTNYFITSRFAELCPQGGREIENDLYRSIVWLLIGYQVDSKAYEVIEKKYKERINNALKRKNSEWDTNDYKASHESAEKAKRAAKKMHRNGLNNLFNNNGEAKSLETFRLQVHEALHVRKITDRKELESQPKKRVIQEGVRSLGESTWLKGKSKLLNINQVSSALSIYMGDPHHKTVGNIHLSKRKKVKQYYFGLDKEVAQQQVSMMPLGEMSLNSEKNNDWSLIVDSLRQKSDHASVKKSVPFMKKLNLPSKHLQGPFIGAKFNQLLLQDSIEHGGQSFSFDFKRIRNIEDHSIHCTNNQPIYIKKQPLRKSSSTFFVRGRGQFERSCAKRKQLFESGYILPRLERP